MYVCYGTFDLKIIIFILSNTSNKSVVCGQPPSLYYYQRKITESPSISLREEVAVLVRL